MKLQEIFCRRGMWTSSHCVRFIYTYTVVVLMQIQPEMTERRRKKIVSSHEPLRVLFDFCTIQHYI